MPIHAPGYRPVNKRLRSGHKKKSVVAELSLTAMVDMFTVLTIFLLQNYNPETGAVLDMPQDVVLPMAQASKELKPSHVVTVSVDQIRLGKNTVATVNSVKGQEAWLIRSLESQLKRDIQIAEKKQKESFRKRLSKAINSTVDVRKNVRPEGDENHYRKVTVQADKSISFEIIKKVMYTANKAGASEVNFAILQKQL